MSFQPDRKGAGKQIASFVRENEDAAAAVFRVAFDSEQAAALQWLQCCGERGPIHGKQGSDWSHGRRFRPIKRHQQRELSVGQIEWAQFFVKAATESSRRALHVKAKTTVFDHQRCDEWQRVRA